MIIIKSLLILGLVLIPNPIQLHPSVMHLDREIKYIPQVEKVQETPTLKRSFDVLIQRLEAHKIISRSA